MAKHEHAHVHCEHDRLKYCKECRVVHCLACKQEWPTHAVCTRLHADNRSILTQPYFSRYASGNVLCSDTPGSLTLDVTPQISCAHGN